MSLFIEKWVSLYILKSGCPCIFFLFILVYFPCLFSCLFLCLFIFLLIVYLPLFISLCQDLGISYLFKDEYVEALNASAQASGGDIQSLGSTELGRIVAASGDFVQGTTLQIPTTGYHTMQESCALASNTTFNRVCMAFSELHR